MADHFPAEIHIGGPIPRAIVAELIEVIARTGASLVGYGGAPVAPPDLLGEVREGNRLALYDDQAQGGEFPELEAFLVEHGIHFDRHCDAHYEHDAVLVCYRGTEPTAYPSNQTGERLVSAEDVTSVLTDDSIDASAKLDAIRQIACPQGATELAPIHILSGDANATPPPDLAEGQPQLAVIVAIRGGVANVLLKPRGITVTVFDYDVSDDDRSGKDPDGQACCIAEWPANEAIVASPHWPAASSSPLDASSVNVRQWKCPCCGKVIDHSYEDLVYVGVPICGDCDVDMEMVDAASPPT